MTPAYASVVRDSKWAATRLDWENEHMEFGLCPPDEVCSPMYGACRHGGEVVVVCMPMPEGHSQIDHLRHVDTARGSKIQAESRGNICDSGAS